MKLLNINKLLDFTNITEIYLFGSVARGDQDEFSDTDILIIIDDCNEYDFIYYKNKFANILNVPPSWISLYKFSKIKLMYNKGSYFLWHIKKEGIKLFSKTNKFTQLLDTLPSYKDALKDIKEYKEILNDIEIEYNNPFTEYINYTYELSVLSSLVRNICITLAYINNVFDFGRISVIITIKKIYKSSICFSLNEYNELYSYRLYQTSRIKKIKQGTSNLLNKWIEIVHSLINLAIKEVRLFEQKQIY